MSIENILRRIDAEAEAAAGEVLGRARAEAERLIRRYAAEAARLEEQLESQARRKAEEERRRLLVSEQLELRKATLEKKRAILAGLYAEARERLARLERGAYLDLLAALVAARAATGREEIVAAAGQRKLLEGEFMARINAARPGGGKFALAKAEGDFAWGVLLREGKRLVDLRLDAVFEQAVERIEPDISAILFAET